MDVSVEQDNERWTAVFRDSFGRVLHIRRFKNKDDMEHYLDFYETVIHSIEMSLPPSIEVFII